MLTFNFMWHRQRNMEDIEEKQKHLRTIATSANILHEFLICCYDPTLQFPN